MNNNCDDQEIFHIFNLIGRHTELKPILDVISSGLNRAFQMRLSPLCSIRMTPKL